jgi:hypothetical protein
MCFVADMYYTRCHFDIFTLTWYIESKSKSESELKNHDLRRVDGSLEEDPTKIQGIFGEHFQNIFSLYPLLDLVVVARDACYRVVLHNVSIID